jgi:uncharacterized protein (DUF1697 family)
MPRSISQRPAGRRLIAFLRAINVGGHVVTMDTLRREFEALGFTDVETFIASGNVIFTARDTDIAALEKKIEARLLKTLGYEVATFVRTCDEVAALAGYRPFPAAQTGDEATIYVGFIERPLTAADTRAVMTFKTDVDDFRVKGREVYWLRKTRQTESPFKYVSLEKKLKIRVTFRGINTVARLAAKHGPT